MTIEKAVIEISKEYKLKYENDKMYVFESDEMLNFFTYYWFALIEDKGKILITDFAETAQVFPDLKEEVFKEICERNGVSFDNWHIEVEYKSNADVANYIKVFDELAERFGDF